MASRWNKPGIPHTDWIYLYEDDLGDRRGTCGMCGTRIRYVVTVIHDDYGELGVGRQCSIRLTRNDCNSAAA